jgi:hypothetical protein
MVRVQRNILEDWLNVERAGRTALRLLPGARRLPPHPSGAFYRHLFTTSLPPALPAGIWHCRADAQRCLGITGQAGLADA